jgi:protocatechuate 3,4-dioxygenase beta subunit
MEMTRRRLLEIGLLAVPLPAVLAACGGDGSRESRTGPTTTGDAPSQSPTTLSPTPSCGDGGATPAQTEGPFFSTGSPERTSLREAGVDGTPLTVTGSVLGTDCQPLPGAKLDFWHADDDGEYDDEGYRLRGHQFADASGRYSLETIVPASYTGRTRHIHVKVQPSGGRVLTTQLYFPREAANDDDSIFDEALLMAVRDDGAGRAATFDFVVESG